MKKQIYIFCTIILGVILGTILHAVLEMGYIALYAKDPVKYGLGLTWREILWVHYVYTAALLILGIIGGYFLGQRWWRIVYIEKKHWYMRNR